MPRVSTIACGSPPSTQQISNKSLAILPEIVPAEIRSRIAPSCHAATGEAAMSLPSLLSLPASSLMTQLAATLASRPFATPSKNAAGAALRTRLEDVGRLRLGTQNAGVIAGAPAVARKRRLPRGRRFRKMRLEPLDGSRRELERQKIGIGKIAVVVRLLLVAHAACLA